MHKPSADVAISSKRPWSLLREASSKLPGSLLLFKCLVPEEWKLGKGKKGVRAPGHLVLPQALPLRKVRDRLIRARSAREPSLCGRLGVLFATFFALCFRHGFLYAPSYLAVQALFIDIGVKVLYLIYEHVNDDIHLALPLGWMFLFAFRHRSSSLSDGLSIVSIPRTAS